jgi:hypothetical protein
MGLESIWAAIRRTDTLPKPSWSAMAIPTVTIRSRVKPEPFRSLTMASQVDETLRRRRPKRWPAGFDNSMPPRTVYTYLVRCTNIVSGTTHLTSSLLAGFLAFYSEKEEKMERRICTAREGRGAVLLCVPTALYGIALILNLPWSLQQPYGFGLLDRRFQLSERLPI